MKNHERELLKLTRPRRITGRGDKYLAEIASKLRRLLVKTCQDFQSPIAQLGSEDMASISVMLVEWAEDIHCDIGLWRALETCQEERLGSPLPLFVDPDSGSDPLTPFDSRRLRYLLWITIPSFFESLTLPPHSQELATMAEVASEFLAEHFAPIPRDSGVKKFLSTENEKIHKIKGKLVWLASQSYLFRVFWELFLSERGGQEAEDLIGILEDFIGQHCTEWCGLGATEILVELLNLTGDDRNDVLSWRERHVAAYRVLDAKRSGEIVDSISLYNIVSAGEYRVEVGVEMPAFTQGAVIYGALVPWRGTWHWSGSQQLLNNFSPDRDAELRAAMLKENSSIAYRYCKEDADMARERQAEQHAKFLDFYKDDLVVFKDGRTLAASENQRLAASWADATASDVEQAMLTRGHTAPKMSFPPEFLEDAKGIAAFSNPEEGVEYCRAFDTLGRGLQKQGVDLLTDEIYVIQGVMRADACSVALMRRIVCDDGPKSIAQAFQITNVSPEIAFEYLLRRYKGVYFHTRYPCLTIVK